MTFSYALWGGNHNPIIPVDEPELAERLIELFDVDTLFPIAKDDAISNFIDRYQHIEWPGWEKYQLFHPATEYSYAHCMVLDALRAAEYAKTRLLRNPDASFARPALYTWDDQDPLADLFLCMMGAFPSSESTNIDYPADVQRVFAHEAVRIPLGDGIPDLAEHPPLPRWLARCALEPVPGTGTDVHQLGLHYGDSKSFVDLLSFWNLRASGKNLVFFDPEHSARLGPLKEKWISGYKARREARPNSMHPWIPIWHRPELSILDCGIDLKEMESIPLSIRTWTNPSFKPPQIGFNDASVLATVTNQDSPRMDLELPEAPFDQNEAFENRQMAVACISLYGDISSEEFTFRLPWVPELNDYYSWNLCSRTHCVRSGPNHFGIVISLNDASLSLEAVNIHDMMKNAIALGGIESRVGPAGRISLRLIRQMGGPQKCRVFKIAGVRKLIERMGPQKAFSRKEAIKEIAGANGGTPNYSRYEGLHLEFNRNIKKWDPTHAFDYLLKKRVFRPGLELKCPHCELEFWRVLDDVKSESICEYCGTPFGVATQLRDKDWRYRRSGLFGRDDKQAGGIAVAVLLQQLHTALRMDGPLFSIPGLEFSATRGELKCEADLVAFARGRDGRVEVAFCECKTRHNIEADDVSNMDAVSRLLPANRFRTFLLFAKLAPFTPEEVELCSKAQGKGDARIIMLSDRELEPYEMYELASQQFEMLDYYPKGFSRMAKATREIYFKPITKKELG